MRILEDVLLGDDPDVTNRSEVREAAILGLAELCVQDRGAEAGHLVEKLGLALFDEEETVRMAAAHTLRALAPAGVAEPAVPRLVEALKEQNVIKASETNGGMPIRRWKDAEGMRLFELDVVAALSLLGAATTGSVAESLATRLAGTKTTSSMRWAAAEALAQSGALDELRIAAEHRHHPNIVTDVLHPRTKPQSASIVEEVRRAAQTHLERISVK